MMSNRLTPEQKLEKYKKVLEERRNPKGFRTPEEKYARSQKRNGATWNNICTTFVGARKGLPRYINSDIARDMCEGYCTSRIYNNLKVGDTVKAVPTYRSIFGGYNAIEEDAVVIEINEKHRWVRLEFPSGIRESYSYGTEWQMNIRHVDKGE